VTLSLDGVKASGWANQYRKLGQRQVQAGRPEMAVIELNSALPCLDVAVEKRFPFRWITLARSRSLPLRIVIAAIAAAAALQVFVDFPGRPFLLYFVAVVVSASVLGRTPASLLWLRAPANHAHVVNPGRRLGSVLDALAMIGGERLGCLQVGDKQDSHSHVRGLIASRLRCSSVKVNTLIACWAAEVLSDASM